MAMRKSKQTARTERLREEKQQCVEMLLNRPWIAKKDYPRLYQQIKDHYDELREWFYERLGFPLVITRYFAKLEKMPGEYKPWMGINGFLTVRDYGLFTFGLWYLEGKGENEQFLLTQMVEEIREHLLTVDVEMDWTLYDHRLSMARALKKLKELDVLIAVDGDEADWARNGSESNVLYECSTMARYVLHRFPKELMAYENIHELIEPEQAQTPDAEIRQRRQRVYRRLVQEPIVYDWEWSEDELDYLLKQRRSIIEHMDEMLHLEGRRYKEGLAFFYPEVTSESNLFPTLSAVSDLAILMAGEIRRRAFREPSPYDWDEWSRIHVSVTELEAVMMSLREKYKEYWSKEFRGLSLNELVKRIVSHLQEWNLAKQTGEDEIILFPALGRWNGEYQLEGDESDG